MQYYDGTKILSLTDVNGKKPEIYMVTDLRTSGKTTFFFKLCIKKFIKERSKFAVLVRYNTDVPHVASVLNEIATDFFSGFGVNGKIREKFWCELFIKEKTCGFVLPINAFDKIKNRSAIFSGVDRIVFDEFQSEKNSYLKNEIMAIHSIHTSLARKKNEPVRYVPLYMLSNHITLLNPYFSFFGINNLHKNTKYLKGDGWVLEQLFNVDIAKLQSESAFNRAFAKTDYSNFNVQGKYLLDDSIFIKKMKGNNRYICTINCNEKNYGIREFTDVGYMSICKSYDDTFPLRYRLNANSLMPNSEFLRKAPFLVENLRDYFSNGKIVFDDFECKNVCMKMLQY